MTKEAMLREIEQNMFLEHKTIHGNLYGTSYAGVREVVNQDKVCILDIDIQGVQDLMSRKVEATWIWLEPPSVEELSRRLHKRNSESEEAIQLRLKNSLQEMAIAHTLPFTFTIHYDSVRSAYSQLCTCIHDLLEWTVRFNKQFII